MEIHFHEVWTDIFSGVLIFHGGFSKESGTVSPIYVDMLFMLLIRDEDVNLYVKKKVEYVNV